MIRLILRSYPVALSSAAIGIIQAVGFVLYRSPLWALLALVPAVVAQRYAWSQETVEEDLLDHDYQGPMTLRERVRATRG